MRRKKSNLPPPLRQKITDFLITLPTINDSPGQQAFVYSAGLDHKLQSELNLGILTTQQFVRLLVWGLSTHY